MTELNESASSCSLTAMTTTEVVVATVADDSALSEEYASSYSSSASGGNVSGGGIADFSSSSRPCSESDEDSSAEAAADCRRLKIDKIQPQQQSDRGRDAAAASSSEHRRSKNNGCGDSSSSMNGEIEAAVSFLADIVKTSAVGGRFHGSNDAKSAAENFKTALSLLLKQHYQGHWYPDDPFKGSGYRCLRVNGVMNPLLTKAAQLSGLPLNKFRHAFPVEFTVWVDPGDVSVRYGEDGSIGCVYSPASDGKGIKHDHQQMEDLKRLAAAARAQQQSPARVKVQQQQRACSTPPPPGPVADKLLFANGLYQQQFHRRSPPTNFAPGSSPPDSFTFSPYDGKNLRTPNLSTANVAAAVSRHNQQQQQGSPSRKYQAVMNNNSNNNVILGASGPFLDRRTPPLFNNMPSSSAYQHHFYGPQQQRATSSALDFDPSAFNALRRTPPFRTQTPTYGANQQQQQQQFVSRQLDLSPASGDSCSAAAAPGAQTGGDFQFYANTHFGGSYQQQQHRNKVGPGSGPGGPFHRPSNFFEDAFQWKNNNREEYCN